MHKLVPAISTDAIALVRESELRSRIKLSHSTIWRLVRAGKFPKPIQLSDRAKAWRTAEIEAWLSERAGASDDATKSDLPEGYAR